MNVEPRQPAMADPQAECDPVEALATQFVERLRLGECPSVGEYAAMHPEVADDIHELFPTIAAIERLKISKEEIRCGGATLGVVAPERLGDFRIIREIGRGGMGIVYEAEQESLGRRVAVKLLPKLALLDPKHLQRFRREARTAAGLHHTNIVPVFGVGEQEDCHYYVMQYIEGAGLDQTLARLEPNGGAAGLGDLSEIARNLLGPSSRPDDAPRSGQKDETASCPSPDGDGLRSTRSLRRHATPGLQSLHPTAANISLPFSERTASGSMSHWGAVARIGIQVADALEYAHGRGILHRDIKPANLIIDARGVVWVADFGLAKALEQECVSTTGDVLGTPAYMAPEQLRGRTDARSDVYSLGLTLYELLTLRPAFQEANRSLLLERIATQGPPRPRKVRPEIPRDLETIVLKAIAHEAERRYPSAKELAADLRCFLEDRPIQARRARAAERLWRWCRRNPAVGALSATATLLLLLVALVASVGYARTTRALVGERAERRRAEAATDVALQVLDRIYERFAPVPADSTSDGTGDDWESRRITRPLLSEGAAAVLEDMLVFYDRLAERSGGDASYLEKVALANRRVGDIRHHLGQLEQAETAYERALDLYEQLDQSSSDQLRFFETATVHTELGIVVHRLGQLDQARESWETALKMLQEAAERGSDAPGIRRQTARIRGFLAHGGPGRRTPHEPDSPPASRRSHPGPPHEPFGWLPPGPRDFQHRRPGSAPPPFGLPPDPAFRE